MKSLILTFLIFFGLSGHLISAPSIDSLKVAHIKIDSLNNNIDSLENVVNSIAKKMASPIDVKCNKTACQIKWQEWIIIFFMPLVILLFSIVLLVVLKQSPEFKFVKVIGISNEKDPNSDTQSSSRFIAILTGLTAIFVATTLVMYNGYLMVAQCNSAIDVDGLWKILAGLGIGVIPYGINVWNKNVKEEAATGTVTNPQTPQT